MTAEPSNRDRCVRITIGAIIVLVVIFVPVIVWGAVTAITGSIPAPPGSVFTAGAAGTLVVRPDGQYVKKPFFGFDSY